MKTKSLLILTALAEVGTGLALFVMPALIVELLLGEGLTSPPALVLGRVTGAALIAIGVACWLARNDGRSGARTGLLAGLLIYNLAVPILLLHALLASMMHGIALWPASVAHMGFAVWCAVSLRPLR